MKVRMTRLVSILCLVAMLVSILMVPAMAAVPMMGDEVEITEVDLDEPATLLEVKECTFSSDGVASNSGFTVGGKQAGASKATALTVTVNGVQKTFAAKEALKIQGDTTVTFTAAVGDTVTVVFSSNANAQDATLTAPGGTTVTMSATNNVATQQMTAAGSYTLSRGSGEAYVHYISVGSSHNHTWDTTVTGADADGWVETKAATCYQTGTKERTCTAADCPLTGGKEQGTIDATGAHSFTVEKTAQVDPTCYQTGTTAVKGCATTGCTATQGGEDIPATGAHTYGSDGKCTTPGCTSVDPDQCAHSMATVTPKAATCTEDGVQGGQYCTICGQGETAAKTVLKATGHDWKADGTCANGCGEVKNTSFLAAAGDLETAYALWPIDSTVSKYEAYIIDSNNKETQVDDQLIRQYPNYMRVDVLGLKAGSYKIKVKDNKGGEMTTGTLTVKAHDRTGFGFVGGSSSGAYNDDGTLKANAKVVYATNATFKTVQLTVKNAKGADVTITGVQDIVNNSGAAKTAPGTPVCIRILGTIDTTGFPKGDWGSGAEGLQVKGNNAGENKNLTIEGVGNDAAFNGFGMLIRNCKNVEVRNIGLFNFADDGISIDTGNDHLWIHNNDFFYGGPGSDSDQAKGDGSLDSKGIQYATESYNHFWDSGKCSLMGMGGGKDHYVTFHHNWFDHSDSRHPRIREAEVHIYNNFYDTNAKYGVGSAVGAPVFVEGNYFLNCKYPMITGNMGSEQKQILSGEAGGVIKSWNNTIVGEKSFYTYQEDPTNFDAYVATSRDEVIPSTVQAKDGPYNNFDTKMDLGVTAAQIESPEEAMKTVTRWAGRVQGGDFQYEFDEETQHWSAGDKIAAGVISELKSLVSNYKGKLVKVGGTVDTSKVKTDEHVCETGRWVVTEAPNGTSKGVKTQYCVICDEEMRTAEVGATTAGGGGLKNTLTYSHFKESKHVDNYAVTQADLDKIYGDEEATANSGYFKVVGDKVLLRATGSTSALTCIQLPKGGGSGISFTVTHVPATVKVDFSSTSDGQKSTLVMKNSAGALVADENGATSTANNKGLKNPSSVTYTLETVGTYTVSASEANGTTDYNVRLLTVAVTEAEAPCEHEETTHHAAAAATCTKDGNKEYWTCNDCKKNFADVACTTVITDITIESPGHKWGEWVVSADGKTQTRTCSVCKATETEDVDNGEPDDPPAPVNTKGLEAAITAAEKMTTVKVDTAAANVDKGASWVTKSVMDALKAAITTAKALDTTTADQTAVDAAAKTLNDAVDTFLAAVQEGTKESGGTGTGNAYIIDIANMEKSATANASENFAPGEAPAYFTVTGVQKHTNSKAEKVDYFEFAKSEGNSISFTTTGAATLTISARTEANDKASNLTVKNGSTVVKTSAGADAAALTTKDSYTEFTWNIPGAGTYTITNTAGTGRARCEKITVVEEGGSAAPTVDKSALSKAIDDAVAAIAVPTVSKDGKDVAPTAKWVTQSEKDTFQAAITAAKAAKLTAASAADVTAAVKELTDAQAAFVAAQENGALGSAVAVTKVSLNKTSLTLVLSGTKTATLTATVSPSNATNKAVTWKSSKDTVATVDQTGKVTAVAEGSATITVTTVDGGKTATCTVTVKANSSGGGGGGGGGGISAPSTPSTPSTPATKLPFVDVAEKDWFHDTVEKAYNMGLMKGTDATHFTPSQNTSRAMIATILYRLDGEHKTNVQAAFDDVASGQWYTEAVAWAANAGVVKGYDEDTFAPDDNITREQLAVMLYRYADPGDKRIAGGATLSDFADAASVSDWAAEAMEWCVKCGIITGKGANDLDPQGLATRAEAVTMLMRFVELKK